MILEEAFAWAVHAGLLYPVLSKKALVVAVLRTLETAGAEEALA